MNMSDITPKYSIIVPVYNRIDEVEELLESLLYQDEVSPSLYEVIIVEDGSTMPCGEVCEVYKWKGLNVRYLAKENEGRSIARNHGIEASKGEWLLFFDSDCVVPHDYLRKLENDGRLETLDCFGGPDAAHESFSDVQKAINFAMTSFLTTGGIRGSRKSLERFTPRTFNMGFRRKVYDMVGGFREMYSEDIDMSTRIRNAGFRIGLLPDQKVYHKRRVDFKKFFRQVNVFGKSRITLHFLYPGSLKIVHLLPALFVIGALVSLILGFTISAWWFAPLAFFTAMIFISALLTTCSAKIAFLSVPASYIQLFGYGTGFLSAFTTKILLGRGRDLQKEISDRKGI